MKRVLGCLLPLTLALCLLAACGSSAAGKAYDPAATAQALLDSGAFTQALDTVDKQTACTALYALEEDTVTDCAVYTSLSAGAEEIAVLTLTDEQAAQTALEALEQRVEDQKAALKDYQPEEVAKLDDAIVNRQGSSVLLVVAADRDLAQAALNELK